MLDAHMDGAGLTASAQRTAHCLPSVRRIVHEGPSKVEKRRPCAVLLRRLCQPFQVFSSVGALRIPCSSSFRAVIRPQPAN